VHPDGQQMAAALQLVRVGKLKPIIDRVLPLEQVRWVTQHVARHVNMSWHCCTRNDSRQMCPEVAQLTKTDAHRADAHALPSRRPENLGSIKSMAVSYRKQ
jgi:hypothetical protein